MTSSRSRILTAVAGALALWLAPGAAHAAPSPFLIPAASKGAPAAVAAGESGAAIVAWSTSAIYEGYGPLTVDTVLPGPGGARRRWSTDRSLLVGSARDGAGNLDLLTARAARQSRGEPRLVLYRARQGAGVRQVWSGRYGQHAAVARRGARVAVAWIENIPVRGPRPNRLLLRITTSSDGRRFTRPRTITGVLPNWLGRDDPAYVNRFALTLDANGDPVVALTAWHRPGPTLVLASLTPSGRVRTRQLAAGIDGRVVAQTTRAGRVAVLVEDTGIEGDAGECVGDGGGRKIWAAVREKRAAEFGAVRQLESQRFSCAGTGSRLVTNAGERIAVLWSNAPEVPPTAPSVHGAFAAPGSPFGAPATIAEGALLRTATYHGAGMLFVVTTRPSDPNDPYAGPLVLQAITAGSGVGPVEPVAPAGATGVLGDTTTSGTSTLLAWQRAGSRTLRLQWFGGP